MSPEKGDGARPAVCCAHRGGRLSSLPDRPQHIPLELWGGVECTVNRVHDVFFDQMERSGHATRLSDLAMFAGLGIRALRYPILWERMAPRRLDEIDWQWADERVRRLRELDVRPIVGLTHHGSGPKYTSLIDPTYPDQFAKYARLFAERYPSIDAYTPINEPVTTARFSGLYGHWYPHRRDDAAFVRAVLNQCRAVVLAMQAIRAVNPQAQLVQTDDFGRTYGSPTLQPIVEFRNHRRWLFLDLLCGRVSDAHPLSEWLVSCGIGADELAWHREHPCPPEIIGVNHYATSDRYLLLRDPTEVGTDDHGSHQPSFDDLEAVRACLDCAIDPTGVLEEAWMRYRIPVAITEAHLGSTREEQLRWLKEFWDGAVSLRTAGVDVRAVTVWALLGSFDWNVLVTRPGSFYEPGPFDVRGRRPRPTALARLVRDLASGRSRQDDPLLSMPGWWRRPDRIIRPELLGRSASGAPAGPGIDMEDQALRPLIITGANGTLGNAFRRSCEVRGIPYHVFTRRELDLSSPESIERALSDYRPWAVVNAAGYVRVDDAESDEQACFDVNTVGPGVLASACCRYGVGLVCFSSDLVFDGSHEPLERPYVESDPVAPLNVYGRSKAEMERRLLDIMPSALIVRTAAFFGPWDRGNFVSQTIGALAAGERVLAALDAIVSPTYVVDLANATLDLLIDGERGIWHLTNRGAVSWAELAVKVAGMTRLPSELIDAAPAKILNYRAARPRYSVLASELGSLMPTLDDALGRYLRDVVLEAPRTRDERRRFVLAARRSAA